MVDKAFIKKAKSRIRRFIETGEKQARVRATDDPTIFEYKAKHHVFSLFFKLDSIGRLRLKEEKVVY